MPGMICDMFEAADPIAANLKFRQPVPACGDTCPAAIDERDVRLLREREELYRLTFNQAAVGIAHVAANGRPVRVNRKYCAITGYSEVELQRLTTCELTHPDDRAQDESLQQRLRSGDIAEYSREKRYLHKNGHAVWINVTVSALFDAAGERRYITVVEDISRRKGAEETLLRMASHDALTGLPNRLLLEDRLSHAIAHAQRTQTLVAVMFVDLDRFKNINDSLGHDAGDEVIVEAGRRIARHLRDGDTAARQGGDEFVVVLGGLAREADACTVAQDILDTLCQPMLLRGQEIFPAGSIGIGLYPRDGTDTPTLLKNADTAMYRAKGDGGNKYQFYANSMSLDALDSLRMEGALRRALERDEFRLYYQPQVDIATGAVIGVEALLRWQPQLGPMIAPDDFIPLAEQTGLIVPIGDWVLATACAQQKSWRDAGLPPLTVSVNLSARQFQHRDLVGLVARLVRDTGCDASSLALEITETAVMENPQAAVAIFRQLSKMGVRLAIDDFGTGYSSLAYLKRFPIDSLKIDRSFVRDITDDTDDAAIVHSVIALAHSMKLKVVAEGVEDARQLQFLREHGCDQMQGYYISKPVPPAGIESLLQNR
ncbi:putative bifunctional diguanylate cyclase/phosphodiesterase [Pseudoduganella umbonata]|uniref:Diguanylate cyclase (GGDEF)-like protein/PAS domain S-box-containing protein n=1 Tax=Pseudoduganella umbonata TaxID=864828 RepID=A0A4P8HRN2_9BURK|nr:EAL domain-containing protein [Pseudoduganella umbonata]MBB3222256.1 diguanylate cyclase (GGDEF)-like protein/PAS domain S-box-containing protein [Pseudoduganella umbonata]QCP12483.1 EAL domain-containing protein [Pseudoduganella umbonata]